MTKDHVNGPAIFANIQELLSWLILGYKPVFEKPGDGVKSHHMRDEVFGPNQGKNLQIIEWEPLTDIALRSISTVLTYQLKILAKVLPDLKSVDYKDLTDPSTKSLSNFEVAQRVLAVMNEANARGLVGTLPAQTTQRLN